MEFENHLELVRAGLGGWHWCRAWGMVERILADGPLVTPVAPSPPNLGREPQ